MVHHYIIGSGGGRFLVRGGWEYKISGGRGSWRAMLKLYSAFMWLKVHQNQEHYKYQVI